MNLARSLRPRFEPSSLTAMLAVGDLVAIAAFVVAGEISHGYHPVADAGRVAGTVAPFLVGWTVASLAGSLYTPGAVASLGRTLAWTLAAWAVAVGVAMVVRSTTFVHGGAAPTFALVSLGVGGVLVVGWRLLAAGVVSRLDGGVEA